METKICNCCKLEKDVELFYFRYKKRGREAVCMACKNMKAMAVYHNRMSSDKQFVLERRERNKRYRYKVMYDSSYEQKYKLWENNNNKQCGICSTELPTFTSAQLDHNHVTGEVRGVLCTRCNTRLYAVENKKFLFNALKYLNKYGIKNIGAAS
jgi:hypothetical protein